jgi:hypothetical protein
MTWRVDDDSTRISFLLFFVFVFFGGGNPPQATLFYTRHVFFESLFFTGYEKCSGGCSMFWTFMPLYLLGSKN